MIYVLFFFPESDLKASLAFVFILERFAEMKSCKGSYYIVVIEDISKGRIIGSGTLAVEMKYIHKAALVCLNAVVFHDKSFTNDC